VSTLEILKAAREKIAKPENWTKGFAARNIHGHVTAAVARNAVCWCCLGAMWSLNADGYLNAEDAFRAATGEDSIANFNDTHTHAEVLAAFDKAIAALEGCEA
jgi:hypothetical protein